MARQLGMTVAELGARMDAAEFAEWLALESSADPLPDPYWTHANLCTVVANTAFGSKGKSRPADFLPRPARPRAASPDVVRLKLRGWAAAMAARKKSEGM